MAVDLIGGLFGPGEGPGLRPDVPDLCAFEDRGRLRRRICGSTAVTHAVEGAADLEPLLCGRHADRWSQDSAVLEGRHVLYPLAGG